MQNAAEANAIGTEYLRADLLPGDSGVHARELFSKYMGLRIAFYDLRDVGLAAEIDQQTASVQRELWAAVALAAASHPTPTTALAISGMNDVLNSQGYARGVASHAVGGEASGLKQKSKPAGKSNAALGPGSKRRPPNDASTFPRKRDNPKSTAKSQFASVGLASFYTEGAETASGERFNTHDLTAAHPTLPFDTRIRVTSAATGRSVVVRVNDRGPFVSGRVVDVSYSAAEALGMVEEGIARVKLDIVR